MCEGARLQSCHKLFKMREGASAPCFLPQIQPETGPFSAACSVVPKLPEKRLGLNPCGILYSITSPKRDPPNQNRFPLRKQPHSFPPWTVRRGTASQLAEKLVRAVGRGFIPGIKPIKSTRASAPEVCFRRVSPKTRPFSAACSAVPHIVQKESGF